MSSTKELATVNPESPPQKPLQNNPFAFLISIPQCLLNSLLNFNKKLKNKAENEKSVKRVDSEQVETSSVIVAKKNPDVVSFPLIKPDVPPIKTEAEDVREDTNPIVLWQVYALGGFIVLKWAWGKWQEMKANAKDKEDSDSPSLDEGDPPAAED